MPPSTDELKAAQELLGKLLHPEHWWAWFVIGLTTVVGHFLFAPPLWKLLLSVSWGLFALDVITGMIAAKWGRRQKITSHRFARSFVKFVIYSTAYLLAAAIDAFGTEWAFQIGVMLMITYREGLSNIENCKVLQNAYQIQFEWDEFEQKLRRIQARPDYEEPPALTHGKEVKDDDGLSEKLCQNLASDDGAEESRGGDRHADRDAHH